MNFVKKIETLWCNLPGHDKVYGLAVVQSDSSPKLALVTFYGPRGKTLNVRTSHPVNPFDEYYKTLSAKKAKGYQEVDPMNAKYGMRETVLGLGVLPGQIPPAPKPVTPAAVPIEHPFTPAVTPKATKQKPTGRDTLQPRSFL